MQSIEDSYFSTRAVVEWEDGGFVTAVAPRPCRCGHPLRTHAHRCGCESTCNHGVACISCGCKRWVADTTVEALRELSDHEREPTLSPGDARALMGILVETERTQVELHGWYEAPIIAIIAAQRRNLATGELLVGVTITPLDVNPAWWFGVAIDSVLARLHKGGSCQPRRDFAGEVIGLMVLSPRTRIDPANTCPGQTLCAVDIDGREYNISRCACCSHVDTHYATLASVSRAELHGTPPGKAIAVQLRALLALAALTLPG